MSEFVTFVTMPDMKKEPKGGFSVGDEVSKRCYFAEGYRQGNRYCCYAVWTRFGEPEWIVRDADVIDPITGASQIIRQSPSFLEAIINL